MSVRTRLDADHPCLAEGCGAPWAIREQSVPVAEEVSDVLWTPVSGGCSRGVAAHDLDAYNAGLAARRERGW